MSMYGDDYEYADSRLAGTIVTLDGQPVYVHKVGVKMVANVSYLSTFDNMIKCDAKQLDLHPVKLGYCNLGGGLAYLMRKPMRRDYKQGLRHGNFTSSGDFPAEAIGYKQLGDVILGKYPTFGEVFKVATGVAKSLNPFKPVTKMGLAWCREWAMTSGGVLCYKGNDVGKLLANTPTLNEDYVHLRQALEEAL